MIQHPQPDFKEFERSVTKWHGAYSSALGLELASDEQLRTLLGEITAQEIRTVRAVVNMVLGEE